MREGGTERLGSRETVCETEKLRERLEWGGTVSEAEKQREIGIERDSV